MYRNFTNEVSLCVVIRAILADGTAAIVAGTGRDAAAVITVLAVLQMRLPICFRTSRAAAADRIRAVGIRTGAVVLAGTLAVVTVAAAKRTRSFPPRRITEIMTPIMRANMRCIPVAQTAAGTVVVIVTFNGRMSFGGALRRAVIFFYGW